MISLTSRVAASLVLILLATQALLPRVPASAPPPLPPRQPTGAEHWLSLLRFRGAGSCSASGCHNAGESSQLPGSEFTTWVRHDKHARAYEALFNAKSRQIAHQLRRAKPHEDSLCLSCHVTPRWDEAGARGPAYFKTDGVSCESCHGPAEKWLAQHFRGAWQAKTAGEKLALGMRDTRSLMGRIRLCLDCHVGGPGADVNHDLIAAGHPRLSFEFAAFHATMPHHWPDAKDRDASQGGRPDFEARAWILGQVASAEASLGLLAHRTGPDTAAWPEFAEYDCYACHHDLAGQSWRPKHYQDRKPGSLPWSRWYVALTPFALAPGRDGGDKEFVHLAKTIRQAMEKPRPNQTDVGRAVDAAKDHLGAWLANAEERLPQTIRAETWLPALVRQKGAVGPRSWDEAAQLYLALAAAYHAAKDRSAETPLPPSFRKGLELLRPGLQFPPHYDSPHGFEVDAIRARLKELGR